MSVRLGSVCSGRFFLLTTLCIFGMSLSCSRTQPPRFYALSALVPPAASGTLDLGKTTLAVGPVALPEYVDRPQIVTQQGQHTYELADFDQWAEPVDDNFSRVLTDNLSSLLRAEEIAVFPWQSSFDSTYRVKVEVTRFSGTVGGSASLRARWYIFSKDTKTPLATRQSNFSESVSGQDYEALVAALSRTIESLSQAIALAVRGLHESQPAA